jgi:antitoxin HigA-1
VKGEQAVTADTALRLARYFGTSDLFWLNLQARYDLEMQKDRPGKRPIAGVLVLEHKEPRPAKALQSALVRKVK